MNKPSKADDCERLLRMLADDPGKEGMSIDEIFDKTGQTGEPWSRRTINEVLCDLRVQVEVNVVRVKGRKITNYRLKQGN